ISRGPRDDVPLNSRRSRKCDDPAISGRSSRDPAPTHTPSVTLRTEGIRSVTMRRPDSYSVRPSTTPELRRAGIELAVAARAAAGPAVPSALTPGAPVAL